MSNRRRLARERLEIYLVHLLLAYRPLIFSGGVLLLVYAVIAMIASSLAGFAALVPAIFLLLISNSYQATLYTARLGAWVATLGRHDD
jgi:hypothetical protein